jgi:cyclase
MTRRQRKGADEGLVPGKAVMKRAFVLTSLIAAAALSITVAGFQGRGRGAARPEGLLQQPQGAWQQGRVATVDKLRDNVYRILNTGSNCTAFITDAGVVLIESGYPGWGREILEKLKSVTDKPITMVINTHAHVDHAASNVELGPAEAISFVAHENAKANMSKPDCSTLSGAGAGACTPFKGENAKYLPKRTFKDKLSLKSGNLQMELSYYGRAHTSGDIVIEFPSMRLAHVGDLFAWQGVPRLMAEDGGSTIAFPETLRKAQAAIKNVDTIITGHTRVMTWQEWVDQREFVTEYVRQVRAAHQAGKTVDEAIASFKWSDKFKVCPPEDTFVSQYAADYPKFHNQCTYRTDQMKSDTEVAYRELDKTR